MKTIVKAHKRKLKLGKVVPIRKHQRNSNLKLMPKKIIPVENSLPTFSFREEAERMQRGLIPFRKYFLEYEKHRKALVNSGEVTNQRNRPAYWEYKLYVTRVDFFQSFKFPVKLYRGIYVESINKLNFEKIGIYWTWNIQNAYPFFSPTGAYKNYFVLEIIAKENYIDWNITLDVSTSVEEEQEINLKQNLVIHNIKVYKIDRYNKNRIKNAQLVKIQYIGRVSKKGKRN